MASVGSSHQHATDDVTRSTPEICENDTNASGKTGSSKRKNPFGSLLSLAWKLCVAEQKRSKLAGGDSTSNSFTVANVFRCRPNVVTSYDDHYAPFQMSTASIRQSAVLPMQLASHIYRELQKPSAVGNVRRYEDEFTHCSSNSPDVARSSNMIPTSAAQNSDLPASAYLSSLSRWGDSATFDNEDSAPDEDELHLSERRRHQCQMCSYQTDNRSHMLRHQATAHDACKLYHCYICKMDFSRSERAKAHFLSIHPEIPYHSKIIRKQQHDAGAPASDVRLSGSDHIGGKKHGQTGAPAGPVSGRKSWEKYCRLVPPSGSSGCYFRCVRCLHVGSDIWHLKRHFLSSHSGTQAYLCRVCRYSTGDVQRLIGHMTGHGELFCHQCSFSTVEMERFKEHLSTCTGEGPSDSGTSQCPVCGDHFEDNHIVRQHVTETHQRDYCEHCGCVIYGPETIEEHLLQHQTEQNSVTNNDAFSDRNPATVESPSVSNSAGQSSETNARPVDGNMALDVTEEGVQQAKYRFGRFSNQTYYCPVKSCPFKATWKKSIELHTLNYHTEVPVDDQAESIAAVQSSSPDLASATAPVAISGLFNCPFCPNCRTFKYRKSYEKHLLQHGVDYVKHPYLVVRSSQKDDAAYSSMPVF